VTIPVAAFIDEVEWHSLGSALGPAARGRHLDALAGLLTANLPVLPGPDEVRRLRDDLRSLDPDQFEGPAKAGFDALAQFLDLAVDTLKFAEHTEWVEVDGQQWARRRVTVSFRWIEEPTRTKAVEEETGDLR
jgi:hypothetical protein